LNYWIFKSEPDEFGIDHLAEEEPTARWDGIRITRRATTCATGSKKATWRCFTTQLQARRGRRYHGSGQGRLPDPAQFDPDSPYFDKSTPEDPRWYCVDVRLVEKFAEVIPVKALKSNPATAELSIFRQGRLSIAPLNARQWTAVLGLRCGPE
jgi:predicted RNA-binding protein with PUA-like domain